jgi:hypothetical protein
VICPECESELRPSAFRCACGWWVGDMSDPVEPTRMPVVTFSEPEPYENPHPDWKPAKWREELLRMVGSRRGLSHPEESPDRGDQSSAQ